MKEQQMRGSRAGGAGATLKLSRLWGGVVTPPRPAPPGGSLPGQGGLFAEELRRGQRAGCRGSAGARAPGSPCVLFGVGGWRGAEEGRPAPLAALTFPARSRAAATDSRAFCEPSV